MQKPCRRDTALFYPQGRAMVEAHWLNYPPCNSLRGGGGGGSTRPRGGGGGPHLEQFNFHRNSGLSGCGRISAFVQGNNICELHVIAWQAMQFFVYHAGHSVFSPRNSSHEC